MPTHSVSYCSYCSLCVYYWLFGCSQVWRGSCLLWLVPCWGTVLALQLLLLPEFDVDNILVSTGLDLDRSVLFSSVLAMLILQCTSFCLWGKCLSRVALTTYAWWGWFLCMSLFLSLLWIGIKGSCSRCLAWCAFGEYWWTFRLLVSLYHCP